MDFMAAVGLSQAVQRFAPLIVGGGIALFCGIVCLIVFLSLFRRTGAGLGRSLVGVAAGLLSFAGATLVGMGVLGLVPPLTAEYEKAKQGITSLYGATRASADLQSAAEIRALLASPKHREPKDLNPHEYRVYSQNGEDGIIAEIFRRIGTTNRYFVEFGASDGFENNTALLVRLGWGGFWIDGDHDAIVRALEHYRPEVEAKKLTITESFITAENIEDLFRQNAVPKEFDFLSIDIDRNDYHVWEKITDYRPRVVCIEYNPLYPPPISWVIPYDPKAMWDSSTRTGASLEAMAALGDKKGYSLVGCCLSGVNAFFVRKDLLGDNFSPPYTAEHHYEPGRFRLYWYSTVFKRVP
jgi:hypothetical protein